MTEKKGSGAAKAFTVGCVGLLLSFGLCGGSDAAPEWLQGSLISAGVIVLGISFFPLLLGLFLFWTRDL